MTDKDSTRKAVIDLSEYNELLRIKKETPKMIIRYDWYSMYPTVILDGAVPPEIQRLIDEYENAKPELERLKKVPKWILRLFGASLIDRLKS